MKKSSVMDLPDVPQGQLPPHIELQRTRVLCGFDAPTHVRFSFDFFCLILLFSLRWVLIVQYSN